MTVTALFEDDVGRALASAPLGELLIQSFIRSVSFSLLELRQGSVTSVFESDKSSRCANSANVASASLRRFSSSSSKACPLCSFCSSSFCCASSICCFYFASRSVASLCFSISSRRCRAIMRSRCR